MTLDVSKLPWSAADDVAKALGYHRPQEGADEMLSELTPKDFVALYAQW